MELLYADDLVLMAESEELLVEKIQKWKAGMEDRGLRVNMGKTKVMRCRIDAGQVQKSGKYPCGVCGKGVGSNSIKCTACNAWIHKRCSGVSGNLTHVSQYRCVKCTGGGSTVKIEAQQLLPLGDGQSLC